MKYERKFFSAAREGDLKTIEQALADGFPVDHLSKLKVDQETWSVTPGRTGLMWAVCENQLEVVERLLAAGASPDAREHTGMEAFSAEEDGYRDCWAIAAEFNRPEIMEYLLKNAKRPAEQRLTDCLEHAAQHDSLEVVKLLLREGLNIDGTSFEGKTPLMAAAQHGHPRVVAYLLEQGANVNLKGGNETGTALTQCAFEFSIRRLTIDLQGNEAERPTTEEKLQCLALLLDAGADPNVEQPGVGYPLEKVASNREAAKMLIDAGASPRLVGSTEFPLYDPSSDASLGERLRAAIETSNMEAVATVIAAGVDVNQQDESEFTPLMHAACVGNLDIVKLLVEHGAELEHWGQGDTVLSRAAAGGHREVYEYLYSLASEEIQGSSDEEELAAGELRRLRSKDATVEAFIDAVLFKPIEMVEAAIEDGVDVNGIGSNGETALHYAAYYGKTDMVRLLIESGANVNIRDIDEHNGLSSGSTPLALAARETFSENSSEVVDALLTAGADPNIQDDDGNTPLINAVRSHSEYFSTLEHVAKLVEAGADLEIKNVKGDTALMCALGGDHDELVKLLRDAGASDYGLKEVALSKAIFDGDLAAVRELLSTSGIDLNYSTPLESACLLGHLEVAQALFQAGADVNQQNEVTGYTPLIAAADRGHLEVVTWLLESGAEVRKPSGSAGYTAMYYARCGKRGYDSDKPWDEILAVLKAAEKEARKKK